VNGFYTSDEEVKRDLVTGGALGNIVVNDSKVDPWIYGILIGTTFQASPIPLVAVPSGAAAHSARADNGAGTPGLAQPPPDVPPAEIFILILPTLYTVRQRRQPAALSPHHPLGGCSGDTANGSCRRRQQAL
jgi:hypothetical protein